MQNTLQKGTVLHGKMDYTIDHCLGVGGFGLTYLATAAVQVGNIRTQVPFAIKEFFAENACTRLPNGDVTIKEGEEECVDEHKQRFLSEAKRLHELDEHKSIVRVNEIFEQNNTVYYVMAYLGSENLNSYVKSRGGKLPEDEALRIFKLLAEALRYLHSKRINHLDVKPANVMMHQDDKGETIPVLIDFGLALYYDSKGQLANDNLSVCCSDGFAPAEQYEGITSFAPEADIYALGALLLYMLSGLIPPVATDMSDEWIDTHLDVNVSIDTKNMVKRCMARKPAQRYQCIADLPITASYNMEEQHTRVIGKKQPAKKKPVAATTASKSGGSGSMSRLITYIGAGVIVGGGIIGGVLYLNNGGSDNQDEVTAHVDSLVPEQPKEPVTQPVPETPEKPDTPTTNDPGTTVVNPTPKPQPPVVDPVPPTPSGPQTIDLGYATYTGPVKNGKPHGTDGVLTFKRQHVVDSNDHDRHEASPGDKIRGRFKDGHLVDGTWTKSDGTSEDLYIGR